MGAGVANKDVRALIRRLKRVPGVTVGRGSHPKVSYNGTFVVSLPGTPSDARWERNALSAIRRAGINLDHELARPANGQSPPPLPDMEEIGMKRNTTVSASLAKEDRERVAAIIELVTAHYGLRAREGRPTPWGAVPKLAAILYEYSQASGEDVPHLNYRRHYDVTDMREMARLAANGISDVYAHNHNKISHMTHAKIDYAMRAMEWWELQERDENGGLVPTETLVNEALADDPDSFVRASDWDPTPVAATNGRGGDDNLHLRVLAKLAAGGTPEDEAIALALEIRDAVR